jgi:hypothetical protein
VSITDNADVSVAALLDIAARRIFVVGAVNCSFDHEIAAARIETMARAP